MSEGSHDQIRRPMLVGHRGASSRFPENTMASFRGAVEDGAAGIELDVRLSRDRQPVVIHDATLDRTTRSRGPVRALTRAELENVRAVGARWKSRHLAVSDHAGADFGVPGLERVLEFARSTGLLVFVELKLDAAFEEGLDEVVAGLIGRMDAFDLVNVTSFNAAAIARVKALDARIVTGLNIIPTLRSPLPSPAQIVERVRRAGADAAGLHVSLATRRRVDALRAAGLAAHVWTVNRDSSARRCVDIGVDSVMTDHPAALSRIVRGA